MTTILIVDDRAVNRQFMTTLLRYFNYEVLECVNGVEALFVMQAKRPDIVITDILMPEMDGLELAHRLRNDPDLRAIKIIFYSATYRLHYAREMVASLGVRHVIGKPAEPALILDTISMALGEDPDGGAARRQAGAIAKRPAGGLTRQYIRTVDNLEAMSIRLAAVIELCLDLTAERDLDGIVNLFCGAARDLLGARHAAVAITEGRGGVLLRFAARGYGEEEESRLREAAERRSLLPTPPTGQQRILHPTPGVTLPALGFPSACPAPSTLLAVSLANAERDLGWFYVSGKVGAKAFDDEDIRIAHSLGALAALVYENALLFEEIQGHAAALEREVTARGRAYG
jgi:CheY-like chemotaxis protein